VIDHSVGLASVEPGGGSRAMADEAPRSDVDLWSDEVLLEPWEHYRGIRELGPAVYLER